MDNNILNDKFLNTFLFQNYIWSCSPNEFVRWVEFISLLHGDITFEMYNYDISSKQNNKKRLPIFKQLTDFN